MTPREWATAYRPDATVLTSQETGLATLAHVLRARGEEQHAGVVPSFSQL